MLACRRECVVRRYGLEMTGAGCGAPFATTAAPHHHDRSITADQPSTPTDEARRLYEEGETHTANAMEQLVSRDGVGQLLAWMTENVVALTRVSSDAFDLGLRNLRVAGRQDITRLGRQIGRTEDKLEMVLQEVERIGQRLEERSAEEATTP